MEDFACKGEGSHQRICELREKCLKYHLYITEIIALEREDFPFCNYLCVYGEEKFIDILK